MDLIRPADPKYDDARQAWNLTVDQRPAAVALPRSADEVAEALQDAAERGLRVAPQATGHRAPPLGDLGDTLLLKTARMRGIAVDPERRVARIEAGVQGAELVEAIAPEGLATLSGSGPDVGVVGYATSGGVSLIGRTHGLAAHQIEAAELVTAKGQLVHVDREREPDLHWAVRGGGGSLAVVTALELRLLPIAEVYAGVLRWPIERGPEVLHAWAKLTQGGLPDELATIGRYQRFPPLPMVPEELRGKAFVTIEVIHVGDSAQADELLAPLRALGPDQGTIGTIPAKELVFLHGDPPQPSPGVSDGILLRELPAEAVDAIVERAGAASDAPLVNLEVRHLDGALARPPAEPAALERLDAAYVLAAVGIALTPEQGAAVRECIEGIKVALAPWTAAQSSLNFADTPREGRSFWTADAYERLRHLKSQLDPDDRIRAAHSLARA
ncbi:MAG: FAD-binding oxidoreductase [Solirubrobacteraceae bacterium]